MKIGIDFGTSFSLPAALINGNPAEDRSRTRPENVVRNVKMEISNASKKTFRLSRVGRD